MFLDLAMPVKVDLSSQSWRVIPTAIMIKAEGVAASTLLRWILIARKFFEST